MPYQAVLKLTFNASHALDELRPEPHFHDWIIHVTLEAEALEPPGIIVNYFDLVPLIKSFLPNGTHLNNTLPVAPTAENMAKYFYKQMKPALPALKSVAVGEFESFMCTYTPS